MSYFEVDSERVISAAGMANKSVETLSTETDALMAHLNSLADSWKGGAAQNFQTVAKEWEGVQRRVHESLGKIRDALQTAGTQYSDVENSNMRMFSS